MERLSYLSKFLEVEVKKYTVVVGLGFVNASLKLWSWIYLDKEWQGRLWVQTLSFYILQFLIVVIHVCYGYRPTNIIMYNLLIPLVN